MRVWHADALKTLASLNRMVLLLDGQTEYAIKRAHFKLISDPGQAPYDFFHVLKMDMRFMLFDAFFVNLLQNCAKLQFQTSYMALLMYANLDANLDANVARCSKILFWDVFNSAYSVKLFNGFESEGFVVQLEFCSATCLRDGYEQVVFPKRVNRFWATGDHTMDAAFVVPDPRDLLGFRIPEGDRMVEGAQQQNVGAPGQFQLLWPCPTCTNSHETAAIVSIITGTVSLTGELLKTIRLLPWQASYHPVLSNPGTVSKDELFYFRLCLCLWQEFRSRMDVADWREYDKLVFLQRGYAVVLTLQCLFQSFCAIKFCMSQWYCESHLWNVFEGCVQGGVTAQFGTAIEVWRLFALVVEV